MKPLKVYIAAPFRRPDPIVNTNAAIKTASELSSRGLIPFCPHLSLAWHLVDPHPDEFWLEYDMHWLRVCDVVLRLGGESVGADAEVAEAKRLGIPVFMGLAELYTYAVSRP